MMEERSPRKQHGPWRKETVLSSSQDESPNRAVLFPVGCGFPVLQEQNHHLLSPPWERGGSTVSEMSGGEESRGQGRRWCPFCLLQSAPHQGARCRREDVATEREVQLWFLPAMWDRVFKLLKLTGFLDRSDTLFFLCVEFFTFITWEECQRRPQ